MQTVKPLNSSVPKVGRCAHKASAKDISTLSPISRLRSTSSRGARMYGLTEADKKQWEALCAAYCRPKPSEPIKKCVVRITYIFRTRQRHDPDNYNGKFILDGLREAGIIEDDSFKNVELQLCGAYDKENPRTEIEVIL